MTAATTNPPSAGVLAGTASGAYVDAASFTRNQGLDD
jgi:hypothetical protein